MAAQAVINAILSLLGLVTLTEAQQAVISVKLAILSLVSFYIERWALERREEIHDEK